MYDNKACLYSRFSASVLSEAIRSADIRLTLRSSINHGKRSMQAIRHISESNLHICIAFGKMCMYQWVNDPQEPAESETASNLLLEYEFSDNEKFNPEVLR